MSLIVFLTLTIFAIFFYDMKREEVAAILARICSVHGARLSVLVKSAIHKAQLTIDNGQLEITGDLTKTGGIHSMHGIYRRRIKKAG